MFTELPKLLDRNFAIGFYLPVVVFLLASVALANLFGIVTDLDTLISTNTLLNVTVLVLVSWLGAICLMALNRSIIRFLQGYGDYNPARPLYRLQVKRYNKLSEDIARLNKDVRLLRYMNASIPEDTRQKRLTASFELARNFPVGELEGIQPTTFGNVIRAFESYPRIMYGFEPVHGWHRLLAVIPKDYRALVDEAKTQTDFWVNIWVVAVLVFVEYIGFAWYKLEIMGASNSPATLAFPLLALVIAFISIWRANMAAVVWGEMVKSAYDVYLPVLYKKMGFSFPSDRHEEREILTRFSQAIIYRSPESMPRRVSPASEKDKGNVRMRGTKG